MGTEERFSVLLIYEYVPENTNVFFFRVNKAVFDKLMLCHDKMINQIGLSEADEKNLEWLSKIVENNEPIFSTMINYDSPSFNTDMRIEKKIGFDGEEAITDSDEEAQANPIPENLRTPRKKKIIDFETSGVDRIYIVYSGFIL
jgi:hypothetical protein